MKRFILFLSFIVLAFSSCESDYTVLKSIDSVILTADTTIKLTGEPITFTVSNAAGDDLTSQSEIFVNGSSIEGNVFTSEELGYFEVKAVYMGVESNPVTVNFHDGSEINFKQRVLIEDYTGTWCGFCPTVAHAIELVKAQTENAVPVAIHRPTSNPNSLNYDPYNYDASELEALLSSAGYPKGYLNRMTLWQSPQPNYINQVVALTQGVNPKLGLAMNATVENGTINLDVNVKFGKDFSNIKLVVYVLENGLIYEQHNYTEYYNGEDVIEDFEHNHVLRECLTPILGETITGNTTIANTYTKSFTAPVPANFENVANIEFVAFVIDANGNSLNVRSALPGDVQEFEEL